jgi:hypothetical protein
VHFRHDLYELDERLKRALDSRSPEPARPAKEKTAGEEATVAVRE